MKKPKFLIIEDQKDIRQMLEMFFRRSGEFEVHTAAEPTKCPLYLSSTCECPKESPCGDLLLVDNYLPLMTGLEFIQRQIAKGCKGSVKNKAVMSAGLTPNDMALARSLGCKIFDKPFRLKDIYAWAQSALAAPATAAGS